MTQPELAFYTVMSGRINAVGKTPLGTLESRQAVLHAAFVSGSSVFLAFFHWTKHVLSCFRDHSIWAPFQLSQEAGKDEQNFKKSGQNS